MSNSHVDEELNCNHGPLLTQVRTVVFSLFEVTDIATATLLSQELLEPARLDVAQGVVILQIIDLVPHWLDLSLANQAFPQVDVLARNGRRLRTARVTWSPG